MKVNTRVFHMMGTEVPVVFNAGCISKWLGRIEKENADIVAVITRMNDHEMAMLVYTGMEYGYEMQGLSRCPYSFYEVEDYLLEEMSVNQPKELDDMMIFAMECVAGRVDRIAKKNGIDLNMTEVFAGKLRTQWKERWEPVPKAAPEAEDRIAEDRIAEEDPTEAEKP